MMDYEEVYRSDLLYSISSINGCSQYVSVGFSDGSLRIFQSNGVISTVTLPPTASKSVMGISIDSSGDSLSILVGDSSVYLLQSVLSEKPVVRDLKPKIEYSHLPITCIAISPLYSQSSEHKRIVLAGATGDLIVLSQQGPPYSAVSMSRTDSKGPITALDWKGSYLIWSGPSCGVKILNTVTGQRVAHLDINSARDCALTYFGNSKWLFNTGYRMTLLEITSNRAHDECCVRLSMELPTSEFAPNNDVGRLMRDREHIAGFGLYDDAEISVTLVSSRDRKISLHVIDTAKKDIPVSDKIFESNTVIDNLIVRFVASQSPFLIISIGDRVIKATRRSVATNAVWLIDRGMFEEAVAMTDNLKDESIRQFVAAKAIKPLIDNEMFERAIKLMPRLSLNSACAWSPLLDSFLSSKQPSKALAAIVPVIPYIPRDSFGLLKEDYDKVVHALLENVISNYLDLLDAVRRWPKDAFDVQSLKDALIDIVPEDFLLDKADKVAYIPGTISAFPSTVCVDEKSRTIALLLCLKQCFDHLGRIGDSLDILMKLGCSVEVFILLDAHAESNAFVRTWFEVNMLSLFQLDPVSTSKLLIKHNLLFPKKSVLTELNNHPFFFHVYLREWFFTDPESVSEYHEQQVSLFLQFDRTKLVEFLRLGRAYNPNEALKLLHAMRLKSTDMVEAEAVLLWKLEKHAQAIDLLLNVSKNVTAAVKFASSVSDHDVWKSIQTHALNGTSFTVKEYLEAVLEPHVMVPEKFSAHMTLLIAEKQSLSGLAHVIQQVIDKQRMEADIRSLRAAITHSDWDNHRSRSKPWNRGTLVTNNSACRVCGCPVIRLPPGDYVDIANEVLNRECVPLHSRKGTVLAVVSGKEMVHSRCLVKTAVENSGG